MPRDWFTKRTIGSLPRGLARSHGQREALSFNGRRSTFADLADDVDRVARGLMALGIAPGDKVALWMPNRPEWIHAALGIMKIGAVLVPVNTRFRTEDVRYVVTQSDSVALVVAERSGPVDYLRMVRELVPSLGTAGGTVHDDKLPALRRVILLGDRPHPGTVHWSELLTVAERVGAEALERRAAAVDPDATAFFLYTSGTTGFPKGVMHSHAMVRNVTDRASRMGITFTDTILMNLPLFHIFGFAEGLLISMVSAARQVLTETFDANESLRLIEAEHVTIVHGFDTQFKDLIEAQERSPRDVSSLRTGLCASGMSNSIPIARKARAVLRAHFVSAFGMSEFGVGAALSFLDSTEEQCVEASGFPAPGYEIRVIDPLTGEDQPIGTPGEILVRSYAVMQGYYKKPEETAKALDREGWLHTGDMGILRPDGHLRFMGRYKDMLKTGGENVDPMEVEAFLMGHPAIDLAAVVSYPDARLSEVGVAFVCVAPGHTLTEGAVIDYCRGKIASFKIPRHVFVVDAFPMTSSGKIQKVKLREEALRRLPPR